MNVEPGLKTGLGQLAQSGIQLPSAVENQIEDYLALLGKWNRTYNLTAIREPERMITHHALDALAILPHLPDWDGLRLADIGSGGGIPGILLAIARPEWRVTLIDSNHKKGAFLRQVAAELRLLNTDIAVGRVEEHVASSPYDVVISRAFADLATFVAAGQPLAAPRGKLVAMKGVIPHEELTQLPSTVGVLGTYPVHVPGLDAERHVVIMERM